jgi:DNA-binding transcriptional regulator YhcF (GntR family)
VTTIEKPSVTARIRDRIVSDLHRGRIRAGDRLPSIREVVQEAGVDHRAAAEAYRVLEEEGLVEVRGRSGVYVAAQERIGGMLLSETSRWLAAVMAESWKRGIMIPQLPELLHRCTRSVPLRCAFVESNEDHMLAFVTELGAGFGLHCTPVYLQAHPSIGADPAFDAARLRHEIAGADMVATTAFHGALVRQAAESAGIPTVVVSAVPELGIAVERRLREAGRLTVVCADRSFGERIRTVYGGDTDRERIRIVLADDSWAVAQLNPSEPVLLTRAARRRLLDDAGLTMLLPHSPTVSFESAREVAELVIRLNMDPVADPEQPAGHALQPRA